ncbi:MAG: UDP-N-acetylmuramate--L-alanine ligase [Clostridiales bacterium]|nr:UDP-N-acetylmuramate--L-alanine ligase [Clostridiales bacterium]
MKKDNLGNFKQDRIHFIGVGGCSMSGLAQILDNLGYTVSGSDMKESSFTGVLRERGMNVHIGHDAALVDGAGLVVYTAAIKPTNVEFARAVELGIPMIERSELLGLISKDYSDVICISGCHGKTTITSMLALIAHDSHIDPTVHVGGMVDFLSGGVRLGASDVFITEACEYVRSFLTLDPKYILVNNIDDDHLDYYKDIEDIYSAFRAFVDMLPEDGILFACADDPQTLDLAKYSKAPLVTYGIHAEADYMAKNITYNEMGYVSFDMVHEGKTLAHFDLNVPGEHNAINALGAAVVAKLALGIDPSESAMDLETYHLAGRRFEFVGEKAGVKFFHDYAHHPSEIKACLAAAKRYPHKKLFALFQCNSFTRARTLKDKYALAFDDADFVMIPDLYPGRDIDTGDIHATDLVNVIEAHSHNAHYLPSFADIKKFIWENAEDGDLVVTLGSGDVNKQQLKLLED